MRPSATKPDAGAGAIVVERGARGRSVVERLRAIAPLVLLEPKNHGDAAWVFAGTLGGGLVDGDRIAIDASIGAGASMLLATQASTKIYRGAASQALHVRVDDGGLVVCAPDPVVCFAGATYRQDATIELARDGSLVWLDGLTCGRLAHGERWAFAAYASRTIVTVDGIERVRDATLLDAAHGELAARMGRFDATATILAIGPRAAAIAASLLASAGEPVRAGEDLVIAASPLAAGGAIARIAGASVEQVTLAVRDALALLGDLLGDDPFRGRR